MSFGSPKPQVLTVAPTGTGSFYWTNSIGPWTSFQLVKPGASTVAGMDYAESNFSCEDVPGGDAFMFKQPLTGTQYTGYWQVDSSFSGSVITGSGTDPTGSFLYNLGNANGLHSRFRIYSVSGGTFLLKPVVKAG